MLPNRIELKFIYLFLASYAVNDNAYRGIIFLYTNFVVNFIIVFYLFYVHQLLI